MNCDYERINNFQIGQMLRRFQNVKITCPSSCTRSLSIIFENICLSRPILTRYLKNSYYTQEDDLYPSSCRERIQRLDTLSRWFSTHQPGTTTRNASSFRYHWAQLTSVGRRSTGWQPALVDGWLAGWLAVPCRARPPVLAPLLFRVFDRSGRYDSTTRLSLESSLKTTTSLHLNYLFPSFP